MIEITKRFKIGELATMLGISKATLINWSNAGLIPKPHRTNDLKQGRYWFEDEVKQIYEYRQRYYNY